MQRRWSAAALTVALLTPLASLTGCTGDADPPSQPEPQTTPASPPQITLSDVSVGSAALAERAGVYLCGDSIVASAPAGGIEGDAFVVFDPQTGRGEITHVRLPRGLRPNARWLLTTRCVQSDGKGPFLSVAYQEMPLPPDGGTGVRAAYTLDGERLWLRDDLNQPASVVDDVLVLGAAPEQPESAVDLRTGETVATFDQSVQGRTVVSGERMVVRGLGGPPRLTTLTGDPVATLEAAASYTADGGLLFATTPAALPDTGGSGEPGDGGLTDASPSPSPTESGPPPAGSGLFRGAVHAYDLRTGEDEWRLSLAPDPLGAPAVERRTGIVVVVDVNGTAHGIDPTTGRQEWRTPTELESPRVTAAGGIVLFDRLDERFQKLVDARSGLPLPEPEDTVVDLASSGALQMLDGGLTRVPASRLRNPPTTTPEPTD